MLRDCDRLPQSGLSSIQRIIFKSSVVQIGLFRCPVSYPHFANTGSTSNHLIVFPRTSVQITHPGKRTIVADPNTMMFYNNRQTYFRERLSERGDLSDWFAFNPELILDALRPYDPGIDDHRDHPFLLTHAPAAAEIYLQQRLVVETLLHGAVVDPLLLEEMLVTILARVIANIQGAVGFHMVRRTRINDVRETIKLAQQYLGLHFREQLSLDRVAHAVYSSPYHLARNFHLHTRQTLHAYLTRLRLAEALEYLTSGNTNLSSLGVELGFSSHSHFSTAFKQQFGISPSAFRTQASARKTQEMRNLLKA
jgi:AraC-like DNA-binding protein